MSKHKTSNKTQMSRVSSEQCGRITVIWHYSNRVSKCKCKRKREEKRKISQNEMSIQPYDIPNKTRDVWIVQWTNVYYYYECCDLLFVFASLHSPHMLTHTIFGLCVWQILRYLYIYCIKWWQSHGKHHMAHSFETLKHTHRT